MLMTITEAADLLRTTLRRSTWRAGTDGRQADKPGARGAGLACAGIVTRSLPRWTLADATSETAPHTTTAAPRERSPTHRR